MEQTKKTESAPSLEDLCLEVIHDEIAFFSTSSQQVQMLSQLPDEVKLMIYSYFQDAGHVTDEIISLFLPTGRGEINFGEFVMISDASLATVADRMGDKLTHLTLNGCYQLTDIGTIIIASSCPSLSTLNMAGCPAISAKSMEVLGQKCPRLQELDVSDCPLIDDEAFYYITMIPALAILNLSECNRLRFDISPTASPRAEYWASLAKTSMKSLCMRTVVSLSDLALLRLVRMFPALRILDISFSSGRITDRGVEAVSLSPAHETLFSLNLWGAKLTDAAIECLAKTCTGLKTLTISDSPNITENAVLLLISKMRSLRTLTMWGCTGISAVSLQLFLKYFNDMTSLGLNYCTQVMDYSLKGLEKSTELRSLELEGCHQLTDEAIRGLGSENITSINLRGCTNLTAAAISAVVDRSPNVSTLSLCRLPLDDMDFRSILLSAKYLTRLNIAVGEKLTDTTMNALLDSDVRDRLQSLKVDNCTSLTDDFFHRLLTECPNLTDLSANFCTKMTDFSLTILLKSSTRRRLRLKRLSLAGCFRISCAALSDFIELCPKLNNLMATLTGDPNDLLLARLGRFCPALETLAVGRSKLITSSGLRLLVKGCKGVKNLDFSGCSELTDSALTQLTKVGSTLRSLDLSDCPLITPEQIMDFLVPARDLQTLTVKASAQQYQLPPWFFAAVINLRPYLKIVKNY